MNKSFSFPISHGLKEAALPLIPVMVGEYAICFIIDTGSNISLIDSSIVNRLGDLVTKNDKRSFILGIDGKYTMAESTAIITFNLEGISFTHSFISESLFEPLIKIEMESNIQVHGVLGNDFLIVNKWIIDFDKLIVTYENNK